jgi:hypothetical protein
MSKRVPAVMGISRTGSMGRGQQALSRGIPDKVSALIKRELVPVGTLFPHTIGNKSITPAASADIAGRGVEAASSACAHQTPFPVVARVGVAWRAWRPHSAVFRLQCCHDPSSALYLRSRNADIRTLLSLSQGSWGGEMNG